MAQLFLELDSLADCWAVPFGDVRSGDNFVILIDDEMEECVWASAVRALERRGALVTVALFDKLPHHCADPPSWALRLAAKADVILALTSTALNSGTPGLRALRSEGGGSGKKPVWLMEQLTKAIMLTGGGRATEKDVEEICETQQRVGAVLDHSATLSVLSPGGSDFRADISGMPPAYFETRWAKRPFRRDDATGMLAYGTWPFGEVHAEPVPGTANGQIVWDVTGHHPEGQWDAPVALTIEDGWVTAIEGAAEANAIRAYLERFGDENSRAVGGEIAIGTNPLCPRTTSMRSEKKRLGAMHFGIGHGSDRGVTSSVLRLEGIVDSPTVYADDVLICADGRIVV